MTKDLFTAQELRDQGMSEVIENAGEVFRATVYGYIRKLPEGWTGIAEEIRLGSGATPHHHNAWGAVINQAVKRGWLVKTGEYRSMRTRASHARSTPVYRRTAEQAE